MSALYISSVVDPPVAVVNQVRGATIGLQHLEFGEQAQDGLLADPAVSRWLTVDKSSLSQTNRPWTAAFCALSRNKACQGLSVT